MDNINPNTQDNTQQEQIQAARHPVASILGRLLIGGAFAALALLLFVKLADEVIETETMRFDTWVIRYFLHHSYAPVHAFMAGVTWVGSGPIQTGVVVIIAGWFLWKKRFWPDGVAILLAGIGGVVVINVLKSLFHRTRPEAIFYHLGYSFPSGHSFFAVVVYGMIAYELTRRGPPSRRAWIWAVAIFAMLLVGFSRVYLTQHYPTDVAGGYLAGIIWLWACTSLPVVWGKHGNISAENNVP